MPSFRLEPTERFVFNSFMDCNMAEAWVGERFRIFPGKYGEDPVWGPANALKYADGADPDEVFLTPREAFTAPAMPPNAAPGATGPPWCRLVRDRVPAGARRRPPVRAVPQRELPRDAAVRSGDRRRLPRRGLAAGLRGEGSVQAVPRIGIMRSDDGGLRWSDRGVILSDRDERMVRSPINRNNTFPGGVGDPSAVASGDHLYVFFGEYAYPQAWDAASHDGALESSGQCISVARIPLADLDDPAGAARRWGGTAFDVAPDRPGQPIRSLQIPDAAGGGAVSAGDRRFYWGPR